MKVASIFILLVLCAAGSFSQHIPGKRFELSFSGGYESVSSGSSSGSGVFLLTPRLGYFVFQGIEIEGEGTMAFAGGSDPAYVFNGNLSYNFPLEGRAFPFILVGLGVANSVPTFNVPILTFNHTSLGVLNLGVGIKALVGENVSMRVEYRYQKFTGSQQIEPLFTYPYYANGAMDIDIHLTSVMAGFSVFF